MARASSISSLHLAGIAASLDAARQGLSRVMAGGFLGPTALGRDQLPASQGASRVSHQTTALPSPHAATPPAIFAPTAGSSTRGLHLPPVRPVPSSAPAMTDATPNRPHASRATPTDAAPSPAGELGATGDRTDERLLIASREGDRDAFRRLMERHREDLLRFLVRFLGSRTAADDVFQETFLQVHVAADTFDAERRFRPWLFAIAANKARDHHRRNKRRSAASLSAPVGDGEASLVDLMAADGPTPDAPAAREEVQWAVKRVVDEMPGHYREILLLSYFQKMSYQQIAECLSIPLGTVKSRLHAAVAHFASAWKAARAASGRDEEGDFDPFDDRSP